MVLRILQHSVVNLDVFGYTCQENSTNWNKKPKNKKTRVVFALGARSTCPGIGKCFITQLAIILEWTTRI